MKKLDYLCYCKSDISNVYNVVEGDCLLAMKIVHLYANGCFDWLISGQESVNPSREAISIMSGKYKRFMFLHPVASDYSERLYLTLKMITLALLHYNICFHATQ